MKIRRIFLKCWGGNGFAKYPQIRLDLLLKLSLWPFSSFGGKSLVLKPPLLRGRFSPKGGAGVTFRRSNTGFLSNTTAHRRDGTWAKTSWFGWRPGRELRQRSYPWNPEEGEQPSWLPGLRRNFPAVLYPDSINPQIFAEVLVGTKPCVTGYVKTIDTMCYLPKSQCLEAKARQRPKFLWSG